MKSLHHIQTLLLWLCIGHFHGIRFNELSEYFEESIARNNLEPKDFLPLEVFDSWEQTNDTKQAANPLPAKSTSVGKRQHGQNRPLVLAARSAKVSQGSQSNLKESMEHIAMGAVSAESTNVLESMSSRVSNLSGSTLIEAYLAALAIMILLVNLMFYQQGFMVCFQVILYVCCLSIVKISLKIVYEHDFHYPKFITACHLLVSSSAAFVVLLYRKYSCWRPIPVPTTREFFMGIFPIACTFGFSIASENMGLVLVSVAFAEVAGASNPVMSAFVTWALGMHFPPQLLLPIGTVVLGCVISVTGDIHFSGLGLVLLLLSTFFRSIKAAMQQKLMTGETKEKFDPVTLMAWTCLCAFFVVMTYSALTEKMAPIDRFTDGSNVTGLLVSLFTSCVVACTLNISSLFVIKQLGAVGMQMVSQIKAVLVVVGGIALLSETFTGLQWTGFGLVLCGVYWYTHMQQEFQRALNEKANGYPVK